MGDDWRQGRRRRGVRRVMRSFHGVMWPPCERRIRRVLVRRQRVARHATRRPRALGWQLAPSCAAMYVPRAMVRLAGACWAGSLRIDPTQPQGRGRDLTLAQATRRRQITPRRVGAWLSSRLGLPRRWCYRGAGVDRPKRGRAHACSERAVGCASLPSVRSGFRFCVQPSVHQKHTDL